MSSPAFGTPEWAGAKEYAVLMRLAGGNRFAAQELWLRKGRNHTEAPPDAGASAPRAAQQVADRRPKPAPTRAQAVSKPRTAAQIARHERSQKQLRQKHLARKMWASVRIASRLLAWRTRAGALRGSKKELALERCDVLDYLVDLGDARWRMPTGRRAFMCGYPGGQALPFLVGKLLLQQWPSARARLPYPAVRLLGPPKSPAAAAQPPPALALAPPPPPSQQPPLALAAAARAALDPCEMQDDRGSKRDALARTPPRPTAAPPTSPPPAGKRVRAGGLGAVLAAAAPAAAAPQPLTATSYHPAALAVADPNRRFA